MEEKGVPGEKHRLSPSHLQFYHMPQAVVQKN